MRSSLEWDCGGDCEPAIDARQYADDLQTALQALVDVVDRAGGYMTPEDQRVLLVGSERDQLLASRWVLPLRHRRRTGVLDLRTNRHIGTHS